MALTLSDTYSAEAAAAAKSFYETLSEKEKRRYVAVEAVRMGYGGRKKK